MNTLLKHRSGVEKRVAYALSRGFSHNNGLVDSLNVPPTKFLFGIVLETI